MRAKEICQEKLFRGRAFESSFNFYELWKSFFNQPKKIHHNFPSSPCQIHNPKSSFSIWLKNNEICLEFYWLYPYFISIFFQSKSQIYQIFYLQNNPRTSKKRSKFSLTYIIFANKWFERVSMLVILLNCVTLGMYQPCVDDECKTNRCKILQVSTIYFLLLKWDYF